MPKKKTWAEKLTSAKAPYVATLEKPFGGFKAGETLFIASPLAVKAHMDALKPGETDTILAMRKAFAAKHNATGTCPTSTGFFVRIVAEAALEDMAAGKTPAQVTPFWRLIDPQSPLAAKLSCGPDFVAVQRAAEASAA
jgi:hypothetical protein